MFTTLLPIICLGIVGQVNTPPIKLPRTEYKVPSYPGAFLLTWGLVQSEIGIAPEIIKDLNNSQNVRSDRVAEMMRPTFPPKAYRDPLLPAMAYAIERITPAQKKRLGEIYLQYYDVSALADPHVASLVGLSKEQSSFVTGRLTLAHHRHQAAQEAMFERFRKDSEELRKKVDPVKENSPVPRRISYTIPRDIQNSHTDLTRVVSLLQLREMTSARADVRAKLSSDQLAKLKRLKGKPIPHAFYHDSNWGSAGPHPDLALNIHVQAEMGFTLKQYLEVQRDTKDRGSKSQSLERVISKLTPAQRRTLRQYELQYDREYSILRHDIAAELGIEPSVSDKMRLRMEEIDAEFRRRADKLWLTADPGGQPSQGDYLTRGSILESADLQKRQCILTFMTAAQKKRWSEMLGKPLPEIQPGRNFG